MEIRVPGLLAWDSGGEQFTNYLRIGGGFTSKKNPGKKSGKKEFPKIIHGNPGRKWNVHPQLIKPNSSQFI